MLQEFVQSIEDVVQDYINEIHTAIPGKITKYNASKNLADIKPIGRYMTSTGVSLEYPVVTDCPVVFPSATSVGMAFPVKKGDSCLILVSEIELDEWRSGVESDNDLKFDLTSAICLPGMLKKSNEIIKRAASDNAVVIAANNATIIVKASDIEIEATTVKIKGAVAVTGSMTLNGASVATK